MTKTCVGCGISLQTSSPHQVGYVKDLEMDYCERCFKMIHYHEIQNDFVSPSMVLDRLKKSTGFVFFFIDFLNLHPEAFSLYQSISLPKKLVISKTDLIIKDVSLKKIEAWIRDYYHVQEDIFFVHQNSKRSVQKIWQEMEQRKGENIYFVGLTNAGKSSFIASLLRYFKVPSLVTVSESSHTTLDFLPFTCFDSVLFYDTPGLSYQTCFFPHFDQKVRSKKFIKPKTFPVQENAFFCLEKQIVFHFKNLSSVTWWASSSVLMEKVYSFSKQNEMKTKQIPKNSLLFIQGVGFFSIRESCELRYFGLLESQMGVTQSFF